MFDTSPFLSPFKEQKEEEIPQNTANGVLKYIKTLLYAVYNPTNNKQMRKRANSRL